MEIKDLQANTGKVDLVVHVMSKDEPRTFSKFGKEGSVCNAKVRDDTGVVILTLWNEDVDKVQVGNKIHIQNGWCSEYKGEKQVSSGKFGSIEVLEASSEDAPKEVFTNDPKMLDPTAAMQETVDAQDQDIDRVEEEELIE